jgi:type II secretory pathway pseudopilin PulG
MPHKRRREEAKRLADQAAAISEALREAAVRSRALVESSRQVLQVHQAPRSMADLFAPGQDAGPRREG